MCEDCSKAGIYKIHNLVSNKIYIGCASNIRTRLNGHVYDLRHSKHSNSYLQNAWFKYGEKNFIFSVIEFCDVDDLHKREYYWINLLNSLSRDCGYNLKPPDPNGCSMHSEETKEKLRRANKGKKPSTLCIQKNKERKLSEEHKKLLFESRKNINFTKLHREKRGKKILDVVTKKIWHSLSELSEETGIPKYELSRRLRGKRKNNTNYIYL